MLSFITNPFSQLCRVCYFPRFKCYGHGINSTVDYPYQVLLPCPYWGSCILKGFTHWSTVILRSLTAALSIFINPLSIRLRSPVQLSCPTSMPNNFFLTELRLDPSSLSLDIESLVFLVWKNLIYTWFSIHWLESDHLEIFILTHSHHVGLHNLGFYAISSSPMAQRGVWNAFDACVC